MWLASPEAAFLAGRLVWANWDVEELKARAKEIEESQDLLKIGLIGEPVAAKYSKDTIPAFVPKLVKVEG